MRSDSFGKQAEKAIKYNFKSSVKKSGKPH
jgi:hypothetical protein